jgi:hypothetical protein
MPLTSPGPSRVGRQYEGCTSDQEMLPEYCLARRTSVDVVETTYNERAQPNNIITLQSPRSFSRQI